MSACGTFSSAMPFASVVAVSGVAVSSVTVAPAMGLLATVRTRNRTVAGGSGLITNVFFVSLAPPIAPSPPRPGPACATSGSRAARR
jgi:hypothetical protein